MSRRRQSKPANGVFAILLSKDWSFAMIVKASVTERRRGRGPTITWEDCGVRDDDDVTCDVCGATLSGNDPVNGVCQIGGFIGRPIMEYVMRRAPAQKEEI